jgi:two-component sensor histidine kinase
MFFSVYRILALVGTLLLCCTSKTMAQDKAQKDSIFFARMKADLDRNIKEGRLDENIKLLTSELNQYTYDSETHGKILLMLSTSCGMKGQLDSSAYYAHLVLDLEKSSGNKTINALRAYQNIGNIHNQKKEFDKAVQNFLKMLELSKYLDLPKEAITGNVNMSVVMRSIGELESSNDYCDEALRLSEKIKDSSKLFNIYSTKAELIYHGSSKKDLSNALLYSKKALDVAIHQGNLLTINFAKTNYASYLWHNKQFEQAIPILLETDSFYLSRNNPKQQVIWSLFKAYCELNEPLKAQIYYQRLDRNKITDYQEMEYLDAFDRLINEGNHESIKDAMLSIKEEKRKRDSIQVAYSMEKARELEKQFQLEQVKLSLEQAQNRLLKNQLALQQSELNKLTAEANSERFKVESFNKEIEVQKLKNKESIAFERQKRLEIESELKNSALRNQKRYILIMASILLLVCTIAGILAFYYRKIRKLNTTLGLQSQKIVLLNQELNHRVKNNLSFISALLEMQVRRTTTPEAKQIIQESGHRLHAISAIHQQLQQADNDDLQVCLNEYLGEIISNLKKAFDLPEKNLQILSNIVPLKVDAAFASKIGLLLNECITNSAKHAFKNIEKPEINISIQNKSNDLWLDYNDNGPGFQNNNKADSLGAKLIGILIKQLEGKVHVVLHNNIQ